jgi:hypothetical protein
VAIDFAGAEQHAAETVPAVEWAFARSGIHFQHGVERHFGAAGRGAAFT